MDKTTPLHRLIDLALATLRAREISARFLGALGFGAVNHAIFAAAVLAMILGMGFGMSQGLGRVPQPWAWLTNAALVAQFPLAHSFFLSRRGGKLLARLVPGPHGGTLATTTYATIASVQLFALFAFWTPTGTIWWQAEGMALWVMLGLYTASWLLLIKASYDAGAEVQSGALGWMSLAANRKPVFPDMPDTGLFRVIRQPIYVAFALTTWTVPIWTPDQLAIALSLTGYCLLAPLMKERRFKARYGARFDAYKARVPYALPRIRPTKDQPDGQPRPQ
jgi:protein-S-isoprenylcysteine O-methyltransferase Ste14